MVGDEKGGSGDKRRRVCDDLAEMLANGDPAEGDKILAEWRKRRKQAYNQETAARVVEETGELMSKLADEERDKEEADLGHVVGYFSGSDPEPLLRRLMSGPPLSREGQLWLAHALAEIATEGGGSYRKVLKDTPNRRGRPPSFKHSDDVVRLADRVHELVKTGEKKYRAREIAAEEEGISESQLRNFLQHEEWARKIENPESDDDD